MGDAELIPSIVDRLTGFKRGAEAERPAADYDIERMKQAVRDDLSDLLNTRLPEKVPEHFPLASRSLLSYGLPDLSSLSRSNTGDRLRLTRAIEQAIGQFEPRLTNVTVLLSPREEGSLQCRIEAMLRADPVPVPIAFDTVLHPDSGKFDLPGGNK
jgi:type VI secretion system protein ImpF